MTEETAGTLAWNDLKIGIDAKGPESSERVWTAPRDVKAAAVSAANGESEKFLFYRGVGHLACPLATPALGGLNHWNAAARSGGACRIACRCRSTSLAGILSGGWRLRLSRPAPVTLQARTNQSGASRAVHYTGQFTPGEYSPPIWAICAAEMRLALQAEGLFPDEADALFNTWELSYFKSAGLRLVLHGAEGLDRLVSAAGCFRAL